jgi:outer membrane receptor protein involved in Fe transport
MNGFLQGDVRYADSTISSIIVANSYNMPGYTMGDMSTGVENKTWSAQLFVSNISDERPKLFINNTDNVTLDTTARPRTIGVRLDYKF